MTIVPMPPKTGEGAGGPGAPVPRFLSRQGGPSDEATHGRLACRRGPNPDPDSTRRALPTLSPPRPRRRGRHDRLGATLWATDAPGRLSPRGDLWNENSITVR